MSRKRLLESVSGPVITNKDLRASKKIARLGQSIPLDCPYCFGDVFVYNAMGGFTVYLQHEQDFGKEYKRFPNNGTSAGIRLGDFHFLDPTGEAGAELARAFLGFNPLVDG